MFPQASLRLVGRFFAQPRMAADFQEGATCGPPFGETPGVGHGVEAIVAAIGLDLAWYRRPQQR